MRTKYIQKTTDLNFLQLISVDKLQLKNYFSIAKLKYVGLAINLDNLDNFDSSRLLASFLILYILTGNKPYIIKFFVFQTFYKKTYNLILRINLTSIKAYHFLLFFNLDVLVELPKKSLVYKYSFKSNQVVFSFFLYNLNFIKIVETHFAFFN